MGQLWLLKWTGNWAENSRQEFWFRLRWRPFWEQHEAEVNKIQRKVYYFLPAKTVINIFVFVVLRVQIVCMERNVKIHIVEEHYTSQECCNCGCLNKPNDRDYKCNSCDMEMHRDVNGAVNIGLKHVDKRQ